MQNIQILLETMLRCGGNCSGCALSSIERLSKSSLDWSFFEEKAKSIKEYLLEREREKEVDSITLFLGQGDHFLMTKDEIALLLDYCENMIPQSLKNKTVLLITASAIGKEQVIKDKMDEFFKLSLEKKLPLFIQVVFDPKKMDITDKFKNIYINNILYFKNKCGMTELTMNLGTDLLENMSAEKFHNWVIEYGFSHVELNWVMNKQTHNMWKINSDKMFDWVKELLNINAKEHKYEINFVPFLARALEFKSVDIIKMIEKVSNDLTENIYIDSIGNVTLAQAGLVSNLIPLNERMDKKHLSLENIKDIRATSFVLSKKITNNFIRKKTCYDCEYKSVCSQIGSSTWLDFEENEKNNCPWNIKDFLIFIEEYFERNPEFKRTNFDRNPIQDESIKCHNENETYLYFENKFN